MEVLKQPLSCPTMMSVFNFAQPMDCRASAPLPKNRNLMVIAPVCPEFLRWNTLMELGPQYSQRNDTVATNQISSADY